MSLLRPLLAALLLCAFTILDSSTPASAQDSIASAKFTGPIYEGLASVDDGRPTRFDGGSFHGRVADGGRFKIAALAVAHRTLPLGSIVVVSYRGRTATAVVNDRGPCLSPDCQQHAPKRIRDRVLDMTPAVARQIKFPGLGRVTYWLASTKP